LGVGGEKKGKGGVKKNVENVDFVSEAVEEKI
jgi:hypothetical protein